MNERDHLIFALDVPCAREAKELVRLLAPVVGGFKVGLELFIAEGPSILAVIKQAGAQTIILDLKIHDIPATMQAVVKAIVPYSIDFLTCHCDQAGIFNNLDLGITKLLGITVLTSQGPEELTAMGYDSKFISSHTLVFIRAQLALAAGCSGVVCSGNEVAMIRTTLGQRVVIVCPGIRLPSLVIKVDDQKRIVTPQVAIAAGANYIVVGRPIRDAFDPFKAAIQVVEDIKIGIYKRKKIVDSKLTVR